MPLAKIFSLRGLAAFYFNPGPLRDFEKGRIYFDKAAGVLKNPTDPYSTYTLGFTYEQWGLFEFWNGFKMEGEQRIERARKYYLDLPPSLPLRQQALESLDFKLKQLLSSAEPAVRS